MTRKHFKALRWEMNNYGGGLGNANHSISAWASRDGYNSKMVRLELNQLGGCIPVSPTGFMLAYYDVLALKTMLDEIYQDWEESK